ncbi:hypothetical protein JCM1841_002402 [Sporobolomyces salmonicolor]
MPLPGGFPPPSPSESESDAELPPELAYLEALAEMDTDGSDDEFLPATLEEDDEDDGFALGVEEGEEEDDSESMHDSEGDNDGASASRTGPGGGQLRIGFDPSSGQVLLLDADGTPRLLTRQDLSGTALTLSSLRSMLLARFGRGGRRMQYDEDEDEEEQWYDIVKEPQEPGMRLERSGLFGPIPQKYDTARRKYWDYSSNFPNYFRLRELDYRRPSKSSLSDMTVPNSAGVEVSQFTSKVYSGQYSSDGNFFYTACQDFRVYIYDTQASPRVGNKSVTDSSVPSSRDPFHSDWEHRSSLKTTKIVQAQAQNCRWTITDAELSDDNEWLLYSSISPRAHLVKTGRGASWETDDHDQETIDFGRGSVYGGFGIWSLRFSHDAKEVVAGASDGQMFVYDIESSRTILRVNAHRDDVNAVAFGSASDSNLLLSGSDDSFVKVWDRRSLEGERPSGTLVGHTEGLTWVSPKGDGRYVLTNGKDQGMKLWDLRMMVGDADFERLRLDRKYFGTEGFDYRTSYYPRPRFLQHPHDVSVMTYRGHKVLRTLIRCHWSPVATTGQRYLYTGSSDGKIHIYSLDGRAIQVLDRAHTHPLINSKTGEYNDPSDLRLRTQRRKNRYGGSTVRDVSWHPYQPMLMSTAWEGGGGAVEGSIALHEWASEAPAGETLEDQAARDEWEARV